MGLFKRQRLPAGHSLPPGILTMMERFGRFEYYVPQAEEDASTIWAETQAPLLPFASSDPDGFVAALAESVAPAGGWAAYGAARTIWNLVNPPVRDSAAYTRVVDASLEFLRSSGVPPMRLSGYEWDHWISRGGTIDTWIPIRSRPSADEAVLTPLAPGEVRRVAKLGPEADANVILVAEAGGAFVALVDAKWSEEDPRRERSEWKRASTLYDLYVDLALALQAPPTWCADELEPFFPIPRPRI